MGDRSQNRIKAKTKDRGFDSKPKIQVMRLSDGVDHELNKFGEVGKIIESALEHCIQKGVKTRKLCETLNEFVKDQSQAISFSIRPPRNGGHATLEINFIYQEEVHTWSFSIGHTYNGGMGIGLLSTLKKEIIDEFRKK